MKRELVVILLACISMLCFSCKKFSNGGLSTEKRHKGSFQVIEFKDNIDVTLKHCNAEHEAGEIIIETGENLIDNIITDTASIEISASNGTKKKLKKLSIENKNNLNFLRPYDFTLKSTVYYDSLYMLCFISNGIITTDTLKGYLWPHKIQNDSGLLNYTDQAALWLEIQGGSGDIYIKTNCTYLTTKYTQGTACVTIGGTANYAETYTNYDCHGIIDELALESRNHFVNYNGTNKVCVKVIDKLTAINRNIGSIFYKQFKKKERVWDDELGDYKDSIFDCPKNRLFDGDYMQNILPYKPN